MRRVDQQLIRAGQRMIITSQPDLQKLGLRDRVHAVIAAHEWGLLVPGGER